MKNILVTGANGQLGNEMRVLSAEYKEYTCFFTDVAELDICDEQAVMTFVKENNIHVIVNCAAILGEIVRQTQGQFNEGDINEWRSSYIKREY